MSAWQRMADDCLALAGKLGYTYTNADDGQLWKIDGVEINNTAFGMHGMWSLLSTALRSPHLDEGRLSY